VTESFHLPELLGASNPARVAQRQVHRALESTSHVLLVGERGFNLEAVARIIHGTCGDAKPFVVVECATAEPSRIEARLLGGPVGSVDGGGDLEQIGGESHLVAARGGTLFLRDIGGLPASAQARLVRVIRDGQCRIDGAAQPQSTDVRLIGTASTLIDADVLEGRVREDLYRRVSTLRVDVAPLRDRAEDIPSIVDRLSRERSVKCSEPSRSFTQAALGFIAALPWRGNVGEIRDFIERLGPGPTAQAIQVEDVLAQVRLEAEALRIRPNGNLQSARRQFEREYIGVVLEQRGWRMTEAAKVLGIQRTNLYRKVRQLGVRRVRPAENS